MTYEVSLFIIVGILEVWLLRTNWLARKKHAMYEMNPLWRWFDRRGWTRITLVIHFCIIMGISSLFLFSQVALMLALYIGVLAFNALYDNIQLTHRLKCKRWCSSYGECMRNRQNHCFKVWERKK